MEIYTYELKKLVQQHSLWNAFAVPLKKPMIISLVGGGGKTSTMYQLAKEMEVLGLKVIVTTSTHIRYPMDYSVMLIEKASEMKDYIWNSNIVVVGREIAPSKLKGIEYNEIYNLSHYADVLLIEADGAKELPLKVPAEHEPVIIPETDLVIACVGLDSIGQTVRDGCFRSAYVEDFLQVGEDHIITPLDVSKILVNEAGSKKQVGDKAYRIILNKADDRERVASGIEVMENIQGETCILTSFKSILFTEGRRNRKGMVEYESFNQRCR